MLTNLFANKCLHAFTNMLTTDMLATNLFANMDVCTYLFELIYTPCFTCYILDVITYTLFFTKLNNIVL